MILRTRRPGQSILGSVGNAALKSPLPNFERGTPNESILEGSFYEIDHSKLPSETPSSLLFVRAVMVTAKSQQNVTIRYPSNLSLEAYFGNLDHTGHRPELYPALDEKYVMGPELAIEVLRRQIPSREFDKLRQSKYFWSVECPRADELPLLATCDSDGFEAKHGPCFSKLQCSSIKGWALKKFVAYLPSSAESNDLSVVKSEDCRDGKGIVKKEEDEETKDQVIIQYSRKRKSSGRALQSKSKKTKRITDSKAIVVKSESEVKIDAGFVERWSLPRYEKAAIELVEILKKNGAVHGNPVSRAQLRTEARKKIGDTGLLDHLLKHLAGKVVPNDGNDRLRRRCDAEGKMEYWIENADLVNIRKEAGVNDPFWVPPSGWKLGDKVDLSYCMCRQEVNILKEELNAMRRKMAELQKEGGNEREITVVMPDSGATFSGRYGDGNVNTKETYDVLMKKKLILEGQLCQISKSLMDLKECMKTQPNMAEATALGELSDSDGEVQERERQGNRLILNLRQCKRLENHSIMA